MPKVTFIQPDGSKQDIDAKDDQSVMEVALQNKVPGIVGECTGALSCATCHVYVDDSWLGKTGSASDTEEDMLDFAVEVKGNSRLSCQIRMSADLDGLVVTVPKSQY